MKKLLLPIDAISVLATRYRRAHAAWLFNAQASQPWPIRLSLGAPTEKQLAAETAFIRRWIDAWETWQVSEQVHWQDRQWLRLGVQRIPTTLVISNAQALANLVADGARWQRAELRRIKLLKHACELPGLSAQQRIFDALADYSERDFDCLVALLQWLEQHPNSGLRLRQLPIEGMHSKWIEQRLGVVTDLVLARVHANALVPDSDCDLLGLMGLTPAPPRMRVRLLCPKLRAQVSGLDDIEAPITALAQLGIKPERALIVENLETGLALPDMPGCVVIMRLGYAVSWISELPWLSDVASVYWGDLDSHGFAILNQARGVMPQIVSTLMDSTTLERFAHLCVAEPGPHPAQSFERLNEAENTTLRSLVQRRLEQERLPWAYVLPVVLCALGLEKIPVQFNSLSQMYVC